MRLAHIFFNMLGLWMFGRDVDDYYKRWETLRIYLTAVVPTPAARSATIAPWLSHGKDFS